MNIDVVDMIVLGVILWVALVALKEAQHPGRGRFAREDRRWRRHRKP